MDLIYLEGEKILLCFALFCFLLGCSLITWEVFSVASWQGGYLCQAELQAGALPEPWFGNSSVSFIFLVTNGFGLSATWLGATASSKMASPAPGSYSAHLSPCSGCPAKLEMFPTLCKQDQMLLHTF